MDLKDLQMRVAEVAASSGDDEKAHGLEDKLYVDVLRAIADGASNAADLAAAALKTQDMDFSRWSA